MLFDLQPIDGMVERLIQHQVTQQKFLPKLELAWVCCASEQTLALQSVLLVAVLKTLTLLVSPGVGSLAVHTNAEFLDQFLAKPLLAAARRLLLHCQGKHSIAQSDRAAVDSSQYLVVGA